MTTRAVILAAGRGTRMRVPAGGETLSPEQSELADRGLKMLIPIAGRPFLVWSLDALAAASIEDVCIVIGPHTEEVRAYIADVHSPPVRLSLAWQAEPTGSASALLAAESFTADAPFLVVNGDNLYTADVLRELAAARGPALVGYSVAGLLEGGIPADRIRAFALLRTGPDGTLMEIVEKPTPEETASMPDARVSMTCWRFEPSIFRACREVSPSVRGELELPDAVNREIERGVRFTVLPSSAPVADLSRREDILRVERLLACGRFGREAR